MLIPKSNGYAFVGLNRRRVECIIHLRRSSEAAVKVFSVEAGQMCLVSSAFSLYMDLMTMNGNYLSDISDIDD